MPAALAAPVITGAAGAGMAGAWPVHGSASRQASPEHQRKSRSQGHADPGHGDGRCEPELLLDGADHRRADRAAQVGLARSGRGDEETQGPRRQQRDQDRLPSPGAVGEVAADSGPITMPATGMPSISMAM